MPFIDLLPVDAKKRLHEMVSQSIEIIDLKAPPIIAKVIAHLTFDMIERISERRGIGEANIEYLIERTSLNREYIESVISVVLKSELIDYSLHYLDIAHRSIGIMDQDHLSSYTLAEASGCVFFLMHATIYSLNNNIYSAHEMSDSVQYYTVAGWLVSRELCFPHCLKMLSHYKNSNIFGILSSYY